MFVYRLDPMPEWIAVDDVVVDEQERVRQFDTHGRAENAFLVRASRREIPRAHECGTQPLPAGKDDLSGLFEGLGDKLVLFPCLGDRLFDIASKQRIDQFAKRRKSTLRVDEQ